MSLKTVAALTALTGFVSIPQDVPQLWGSTVSTPIVEVSTSAEMADAFACPTEDAMFSYFNTGLGDETGDCIALSWASVEHSESIGVYPMAFFEWYENEEELPYGTPEVEIFRVSYEGMEFFAIIDMVDEHLLEFEQGLQGGVAYTVWEERPPAT